MTPTKNNLIFFMLLLLQSCSVDPFASGSSSTIGVGSYPSGMSEVRRVRVNDFQEILVFVDDSQRSEIILRIGSSSVAYLNISLDCLKLRGGYYFSGNGKERTPIALRAYWYGLLYRKTDDKESYSHVRLSVLSEEKIRVEVRALLKEINTGKILVVAPSVVEVPTHALIEIFHGC